MPEDTQYPLYQAPWLYKSGEERSEWVDPVQREGILIPRKVVEQLVNDTDWVQEYYGCAYCNLKFEGPHALHKDDCPILYLQQVLGGH